ncbi:GntR family transcriptional regulator [Frondihabitans sp. PhB188]|uniref:GntR family transcriptional regulator n=1 Tax=Frondihabitans sp. PhB188 TaxID=2485200 RepID=UPI000FA5B3A3|nr:GntR family transcriptional regulator [Frondihabitans sp. PhB188]ROQ39708.1 GntR family transcriptional regulator [Frondihabitans sp. PhB188]
MSYTFNEQRAAQFQKQRQLQQAPLHTSSRRTYEQLRASIRAGIADAENNRFHELSISKEFGASRNSVRVALSMLVADGLISRAPRRGTLLTNRIVDFQVDQVLPRDFTPHPQDDAYDLGVVTLQDGVIPTPPIVADLMGAPADYTLSYVQLGVYGDSPIFLRTGVVPLLEDPQNFVDRVESFETTATNNHPLAMPEMSNPAEALEVTATMRRTFKEEFGKLYGCAFGFLRNRVEVVGADERTARLLGVEEGSPLLLRQQYSYDIQGRAREYSFTHFRGDRSTLSKTQAHLHSEPEKTDDAE